MNEIIDNNGPATSPVDAERDDSLRVIGHISYALHAIVAIGAVVPGFQPSVLLLIAAFFLDIIKRGDARGTWQESHFSWRIQPGMKNSSHSQLVRT